MVLVESDSELTHGDEAPAFELPGVGADGIDTFSFDEFTDEGALLLSFYPFDFSPVCTSELCALRDAEFFEFLDDVQLWAVSADSVYAHWAFADVRQFGQRVQVEHVSVRKGGHVDRDRNLIPASVVRVVDVELQERRVVRRHLDRNRAVCLDLREGTRREDCPAPGGHHAQSGNQLPSLHARYVPFGDRELCIEGLESGSSPS
jgi:hypothetical protein